MDYEKLRKEVRSVKHKFSVRVSQDIIRDPLTFRKNKWLPMLTQFEVCLLSHSHSISVPRPSPKKPILTTSLLISDITLVERTAIYRRESIVIP